MRRYELDGTYVADLPVPVDFNPNAERTRGVRQNLGFESAGVAPNGRFLYTATENALVQDGPAATRRRQPVADPALPAEVRPARPPVGLPD